MFLFGTAASTWLTTIYGPHILVPLLLVVHASLYAQAAPWKLRILFIALSCLAWSVSVFGERWGLFPKVVHFVDGSILIESSAIHFPDLGTTIHSGPRSSPSS